MINCPNCGGQLNEDPANANRMLCLNCGYALDSSQEEPSSYWGTQGTNPTQPQPQPQVEQPQMAQPQVAQPQPFQGQQTYQSPTPMGSQPYGASLPKGMAIAALVMGVLGILNFWIPIVNFIAIIFGILGLIFGILGISRANKGMGGGKGMAIAGVVLSAISLVLALVINVAFGALFNAYLQDADIQAALEEVLDEYDDDGYYHHGPQNGANAGTEIATGPSDANSPWTALEFTMGTDSFKLLETTLEDFSAKTGWALDLDDDDLPSGLLVQPKQACTVLDLENRNDDMNEVWVSVYNPTEAPLDVRKCVISSIDVDCYRTGLSFTIAGVGIYSTIDEVITALGNPQDTYYGSGGYTSFSYETDDSMTELEFTAFDGEVIDEVCLRSYVGY